MPEYTREMPNWMKHKLESRLLGEISTTSEEQEEIVWGTKSNFSTDFEPMYIKRCTFKAIKSKAELISKNRNPIEMKMNYFYVFEGEKCTFFSELQEIFPEVFISN